MVGIFSAAGRSNMDKKLSILDGLVLMLFVNVVKGVEDTLQCVNNGETVSISNVFHWYDDWSSNFDNFVSVSGMTNVPAVIKIPCASGWILKIDINAQKEVIVVLMINISNIKSIIYVN